MKKSYRTSTKKSKRWISGPDAAASGKFGCPLGVFPAPAFVADFPPVAPEFHQRTHRIRLRNLGTTDKKSSHKIRYRKIPREHTVFKFVTISCIAWSATEFALASHLNTATSRASTEKIIYVDQITGHWCILNISGNEKTGTCFQAPV